MTIRYCFLGWAAVFDPGGNHERDSEILASVQHFVDDEDLYATDFLADIGIEGSIRNALHRSGQIRFTYHLGDELLQLRTEYRAMRELTDNEIQCLKTYTKGQWSDGMGECLFVAHGEYKDYKLQPLDESEIGDQNYPTLEVKPE